MRARVRSLVAVALVIGMVWGCAAPQQTQQGARPIAAKAIPEPIRVGAWNIEWLGTPNKRSGPAKGQLQRPEELADYILAAGVDILGVEEVRMDTDDGSNASTILRDALAIVQARGGGRWHHRLYETQYGRLQCTGLAWNADRVTPVGEPVLITQPEERGVEDRMLWSRPPYGQLFSAGEGWTDFVVVPIHMKSNYRGDFAAHRRKEAEYLVRDLPGKISDADVLIIGDSNCASHFAMAIGAIEGAGFVDLNADDTATHWRYGALDRAFVPREQPEFARRVFEVLSDAYFEQRAQTPELFKVKCSDHYMVITEVDVLEDDD